MPATGFRTSQPHASSAPRSETTPSLPARALRLLREEGGARALRGALYHFEIYRRFQVIHLPFAPDRESGYKLECEELTVANFEDYLRMRPEQTREEVEDRIASKHFCVLGRREGRPVAASWLASSKIFLEYLNCEILPVPDALYVYDNFVDPDYRGRKAFDSVTLARQALACERGYRRFFGILLPENRSSVRRVERYGRPVLGTLEHFRLGPLEHHRLRFDPSLVAEDAPPFRLLPRNRRSH